MFVACDGLMPRIRDMIAGCCCGGGGRAAASCSHDAQRRRAELSDTPARELSLPLTRYSHASHARALHLLPAAIVARALAQICRRYAVMLRRTTRTSAILLVGIIVILSAATTFTAAAPPPPAAAKPHPIPDFEPFSPEEEEQVINLPAREEIGGGNIAGAGNGNGGQASSAASAAASPASAKPKPRPAKPKPSTAAALTKELPIVSLDVSGDTKLRALCASLPLQSALASSSAFSLALPHLTQLLRTLWVGSGLLDAGAGDHLLRVRVAEMQRAQLESAFRSSSASAAATGLREEDLPELFDASMAVLKTMDIDLEAEARLDLARGEGVGLIEGLTDDFTPHLSSRPGGGARSIWNAPLHLLRALGLHPTSQDEVDVFWFLSCVIAVVCASIGVGWALGRRAGGGAGSLASEVNETLAAGRRKRRKQIWVAVGWITLGCAVVILIALVAGIQQELAEERRRLITKRALAQASGPPKGCREGETLSWWHEIARTWRKEDDDPCVAYLERLERSIQPDRFQVAANYLSKHIIVLFARSVGDSVAAILNSQTYLVQMMLPLVLIALFAILIALGTPTMVKSLLCCCCSRGDRDDRSSRGRNNRARLEGGSSSGRRRLREERPSRREMIESASDSSEDEEALEQKRMIQAAVRAALTEAAVASGSSSVSAREAPRLTSGASTTSHRSSSGRRDRRPSSRDTSPVRSRSRSHSRDRNRRRMSQSRSRSRSPQPQPRQRRPQRDDEEEDRSSRAPTHAAPVPALAPAAAAAAPSKSPPSSASKHAKKQAKAAAAASAHPHAASPPEPTADAPAAATGQAGGNASDSQ